MVSDSRQAGWNMKNVIKAAALAMALIPAVGLANPVANVFADVLVPYIQIHDLPNWANDENIDHGKYIKAKCVEAAERAKVADPQMGKMVCINAAMAGIAGGELYEIAAHAIDKAGLDKAVVEMGDAGGAELAKYKDVIEAGANIGLAAWN